MGCCYSSSKCDPTILDSKILECMSTGTIKHLTYFLSLKSQNQSPIFNLNTTLFPYTEHQKSNLLGLTLIFSRTDLFNYLLTIHKASIAQMEKAFQQFSTSGMEIIFKNNDIKFFEFYLPLYLQTKAITQLPTDPPSNETLSFESTEKNISSCLSSLNFVQHACIKGNIMIIKSVLDYSEKNECVLEEFDVHYVEKNEGFNCALLACKAGNYNMIKFLHNQAKVDFDHLNNFGENCVQVLAAVGRKGYVPDFFQCLVYLVETVKVDIQYRYEESLILLHVLGASEYFIGKLRERGVDVGKEQLRMVILKSGEVDRQEEGSKGRNLSEILDELKKEEISSIMNSGRSESSLMSDSMNARVI